MQRRLVGVLGGVVPRRGHELDDPGEQLEPADRVGRPRGGRPGQALEPGRLAAALRRLGPGEITADGVARLPEGLGGLQVGHGHVVADDVARHRQGEPRLVGRLRVVLGLLPGGEPVADRVGRLVEGLEDLDQSTSATARAPPGSAGRRAGAGRPPGPCPRPAAATSRRSISRTSTWSSVPMSLSWNVLSSRGHRLVLLRLAPQVDLGPALGGLGLDDEDPRAGRALAQVGLGEVLDQPVELLAGLGIPAGIHQEPDHALALLRVLLVDPPHQRHHHRVRHLAGLDDAQPEPVDPAIPDDVRPDLDDRLLHADRPVRPSSRGSGTSGGRGRPTARPPR